VRELLSLEDCIAAVEAAFGALGRGETGPPASLGVMTGSGGFHVKAATLRSGDRNYFAAKLNGNFPGNPERHGLPAIQGLVLLADADHGTPLAVMDSMEITILRTGAATAVAARRLARQDSRRVTVCGCGHQGRVQLEALRRVLPLRQALVWDLDPGRAASMAEAIDAPTFQVLAVTDLRSALAGSDVCVTCTPSREAFVMAGDLRPGTFLAAVGADNPLKQEIDPALLAASSVWVDSLAAASKGGDLHHAIAAGVMRAEDVRGELAALVAGKIAGRQTDEEVTVFDSTGVAIEDVAAAIVVYERGGGAAGVSFPFDS
jgi:ornithine cyclodeaminase/alanine dehydrogenase-like protein (mu-crystallin family)